MTTFLILLGYISGRYLNVQKETVARLLIYIIAPVVIFNSVLTTKLSIGVLSLPFIFLGVCSAVCVFTFIIAGKIWKDATKNILSLASGSGNSGYFGLPVAIAIFGSDISGIVLISALGFVLYENSLGFFITARGNYSIKESLQRLAMLPTIYAFIIAIILNLSGLNIADKIADFALLFRGAYSVLGMMLIGIGISLVKDFKLDLKFLSITIVMKFILWPIIIFSIIAIDSLLFHLFSERIHQIMILLSVVPLAANTVAYATELKTHPEKAAMAVLISTLVALFYIPLLVSIFHLG